MAGYTPLFASIVRSSIWDEDAKTCKVWVTMLALADIDGIVEGALTGLAHEARVSKQECATALRILEAPDPDSKNPDNEGRRIQKTEGGWLVLNHAKYRHQARKRSADYYRKWRAQKKKNPQTPKEETNTNSTSTEVEVTHTQTGATKRNIATSCATVAQQEEKTSSTSPKESKSHNTINAERVISAWQKLPLPAELKEVSAPGILAIEHALSELALDPCEPIHESMILEAIENYHKALTLSDSQSHKHKLLHWLRNIMRKTYLTDMFNIENHKRGNFNRSGKTDTKAEYERLKAKGEL